MRYKNFGQHMTKYTILAINNFDANTDPEIILELMDRVKNYVISGLITEEQFAEINTALDDKFDVDIPEDVDTAGHNLDAISARLDMYEDALDELGFLISNLMINENENGIEDEVVVDPVDGNSETDEVDYTGEVAPIDETEPTDEINETSDSNNTDEVEYTEEQNEEVEE